jgi:DNA-binding response OmpR family regulator
LLQTIHDLPRLVGHAAPAVLIVTKELQPADRVRAALAGIDSPLIKPVTRGDVARALEACYVTLPADARRL